MAAAPVSEFVAGCVWPDVRESDLRVLDERVRRHAERLAAAGLPVGYIGIDADARGPGRVVPVRGGTRRGSRGGGGGGDPVRADPRDGAIALELAPTAPNTDSVLMGSSKRGLTMHGRDGKRRLRRTMMFGLAIALTAPAGAAAATLHRTLLAKVGYGTTPPSFARTADGVMHVAFETNVSWDDSANGVGAVSISPSGHVGPAAPVDPRTEFRDLRYCPVGRWKQRSAGRRAETMDRGASPRPTAAPRGRRPSTSAAARWSSAIATCRSWCRTALRYSALAVVEES
jgi:hypothetical protein